MFMHIIHGMLYHGENVYTYNEFFDKYSYIYGYCLHVKLSAFLPHFPAKKGNPNHRKVIIIIRDED